MKVNENQSNTETFKEETTMKKKLQSTFRNSLVSQFIRRY